jgi:hypothetical protein
VSEEEMVVMIRMFPRKESKNSRNRKNTAAI